MTLPPDPRTAPENPEPAEPDPSNRGVSAEEPAEGADDQPSEQPGSAKG